MHDNIRQQMIRYPIFSCQPEPYIDQSQLFKDEELKNNKKNIPYLNLPRNDRKNNTIITIYDKITSNNACDPLYVHARKEKEKEREKQKDKNKSVVTTARNSRCDKQRNTDKNYGDGYGYGYKEKNSKDRRIKSISRFMGELATSLNKDKEKQQVQDFDINRSQKISLLKRIIQHYNIKTVERKYYSSKYEDTVDLIKTFGLKIESVNSSEIVVKKNLHPRQTHTACNSKNTIIRQNTQPIEPIQTQQSPDRLDPVKVQQQTGPTSRKSLFRRIKPSNSFMLSKQSELKGSRENLLTSTQQKSSIIVQSDLKLKGKISQKMRRSIEYSQRLVQRPIKLNISTSYQDKINKYRQFLFMLNYSNYIYRDLDVQRYEKPFKYYVGRGNNGNLIKSLMKKRFWFEETDDYKQAHFIWTQLKIEEIFEKQASGMKIQQTDNEISSSQEQPSRQKQTPSPDCKQLSVEFNKIDSPFETIKYEQKKEKKQKINALNQVKFGKNKSKARDHAPQDPLLKIVNFQEVKSYRYINQALNFKKFPNFLDRMRVAKRKMLLQSSFFTQVHNHLPLNGLLGNKKALYYNLKEYCKLTDKKISDYVPMTYHIKKGLADPEYKAVWTIFNERKKLKLPNYWIMKPGQFSNRGQGITCTNKLQQIKQRINKCRQLSRSGKEASLIVQLYISNPLLYNGRKFDIRVFMMVTIINGKIKGYWYQQGYIRTSSFLWTLHEIDDKYIHLTNDAIQKTCDEYGHYEPGNKLTFADLQRYLHTLPRCGRNMEFFDLIYPQMRSIATDAIRCACLNLDPKRLRDNFEIFGLDFMIDENMKPWLIQVNTNPCLQLNCPILERILPHMVQNAFRIALDPLFPPPSAVHSDYKYSIPQNALHYNKFQLVFDQDRDGQQLKKLYKNSNIMQQLDDVQQDQQQFQADGDILEINDD